MVMNVLVVTRRCGIELLKHCRCKDLLRRAHAGLALAMAQHKIGVAINDAEIVGDQ